MHIFKPLVILPIIINSARITEEDGIEIERKYDHERVLDIQDEKLSSDQEFGTQDYDHDAMLGEERAETFEDLPEEEARNRLLIIFDKIDEDKNGKLSETELSQWIRYVTSKYVQEDSKKMFQECDENNDEFVAWEEYQKANYDMITGDQHEDDAAVQEEGEMSYNDLQIRDERRFRYADMNNDHKLDEVEFGSFLHPEEFDHMRDIVVKETLEEMDTDKDGKVSEREYLSDLWSHDYENEKSSQTDDETLAKEKSAPEWLTEEARLFREKRDEDKDGYLSENEVKNWIVPNQYDHVQSEIVHLMKEADDDQDKFLSKDEVVYQHMDVFVGSQATDFGNVLVRHTEF